MYICIWELPPPSLRTASQLRGANLSVGAKRWDQRFASRCQPFMPTDKLALLSREPVRRLTYNMFLVITINPLTPRSVQYINSSNNFDTLSSKQGMRIIEETYQLKK